MTYVKSCYTGEAYQVCTRVFPMEHYTPNKFYRLPFGNIGYRNSKGFLHLLSADPIRYGSVKAFTLDELVLSADGGLRKSKHFGIYYSREAVQQKINQLLEEE